MKAFTQVSAMCDWEVVKISSERDGGTAGVGNAGCATSFSRSLALYTMALADNINSHRLKYSMDEIKTLAQHSESAMCSSQLFDAS